MRKIVIFLLVGAFLVSLSSIVFAHAEGGKPADAPTLVKQAIDFLEGEHNISEAEMKAKNAFYAVGIDALDQNKLKQAITALDKSDEQKARVLLVESLGQDPQTTALLELKMHYSASVLNSFLLVLAALFILLGVFIVRKAGVKQARIG